MRVDDGVLSGRTLLGRHGVDLTEVQAVAVQEGEEGPAGVLPVDGGGHLRVPWPEVRRHPELRELLLARQAQGAVVLPRVLCAAWDVPALPGAPWAGRVPGDLHDPVNAVITALTGTGCLVTGPGAALAAVG
ncbi:hypothetical protein ACI796_10560 [Geodermatophilus sp. SYSU D00525]